MHKLILFLLVILSLSTRMNGQNLPIYNIKIDSVSGPNKIDFSNFRGKKILIVNSASGDSAFKSNYNELIQLYQIYFEKLVIVIVPTNSFGTEPGTDQQISEKYVHYNTYKFPVTTKVNVIGPQPHYLFRWLTSQSENGVATTEVRSVFYKYLISKEGKLIATFNNKINPMSAIIRSSVERENY
jgi:glutathione peroxidase